MTEQEQQMVIAEACGWVYRGNPQLKNPSVPLWSKLTDSYDVVLPDYLRDLNALHEAEKTLTYEQRVEFVARFKAQSALGSMLDLQKATAAQRAEAFLLAIGKWRKDL